MLLSSGHIATILLTTVVLMKSASADFCSDLKSAFEQSGNFHNLKGEAYPLEDSKWQAKIGIAGTQVCAIVQPHDILSLECLIGRYMGGDAASADAEKRMLDLAS